MNKYPSSYSVKHSHNLLTVIHPFNKIYELKIYVYYTVHNILYKVLRIVLHECTYTIFAFLTVYCVYRVRENVYRDKYKSMCRQNRISVIVCLEQAINVYLSNQRLLHNVCITYQNVKLLYIVH